MESEISDQQRIFAEAYAFSLNATDAAILAGYSKATAAQQGSRLLRNVQVRNLLNKLFAEKSEKLNLTRESLLSELAILALGPGRDMVKLNAIKLAGEAIGLFGNDSQDRGGIK